jgi:nicotinate-nucleotide adenylyltransferase
VEQIIARHELLVYPRAYVESELGEEMEGRADYPGAKITFLKGPVMNISASFIRKAIRSGHDVRYMLTEPVEKYVREMHFYESKA